MLTNTLKVVKQLFGGLLVKDNKTLYLMIFTEKGNKSIDISCNTETLPKTQIAQFFDIFNIVKVDNLELWLVERERELYLMGYIVVSEFESHLGYVRWIDFSDSLLVLPLLLTNQKEISVLVHGDSLEVLS